MSPLPISRSALDRLGERLAASDEITDEDYALLGEVLAAYQAALGEAQARLTALGYAPTTRVKTTQVLVEKLRREQGMKLRASRTSRTRASSSTGRETIRTRSYAGSSKRSRTRRARPRCATAVPSRAPGIAPFT